MIIQKDEQIKTSNTSEMKMFIKKKKKKEHRMEKR